MTEALQQGPAWADRSIKQIRGLFPLAVEQHVNAEVSLLAPTVTTVTNIARTYCLHTLVLAEAKQSGINENEAKRLHRRSEVILAGISQCHRGAGDHRANMPSAHGSDQVRTLWDDSGLNLDAATSDSGHAYAQPPWGFRGVYVGPLIRLGILERDGWTPTEALDEVSLRSALGPILEIARKDVSHVDQATLEGLSAQCICRCRDSADGEWLAHRMSGDPSSPTTVSGYIAATMQLLALAVESGSVTTRASENHVADFLAYDPLLTSRSDLVNPDVAQRWRGLVLRNHAVTGWRGIWSGLSTYASEAEGNYLALQELQDWMANEFPPGQTLGSFMRELPATVVHGTPSNAEKECGERGWSQMQVQLARVLLSGVRCTEVTGAMELGFLGDSARARKQELAPEWVASITTEWADRPIQDFARHLVRVLIERAQRIANSKSRWEGKNYVVPARVTLEDGYVLWRERDLPAAAPLRLERLLHIGEQVGMFTAHEGQWMIGSRGGHLAHP